MGRTTFRDVGGVFWISAGDCDNARAHAIPKSGNLRRAGKAGADDSNPYGVSISHNRIFLLDSLSVTDWHSARSANTEVLLLEVLCLPVITLCFLITSAAAFWLWCPAGIRTPNQQIMSPMAGH